MFNWILLKIDMGFLEVYYFNFLRVKKKCKYNS